MANNKVLIERRDGSHLRVSLVGSVDFLGLSFDVVKTLHSHSSTLLLGSKDQGLGLEHHRNTMSERLSNFFLGVYF